MCREIGVLKILESSLNPDFRLGGDGIVVEIDEAKFGRRKYHRGRVVEGIWVFGAIQRATDETQRRMFMLPVSDRSSATLIPLITKWIKPGKYIFFILESIIMSDGWASYIGISDIPEMNYTHLVVNHSENFVDPVSGACTNQIEGNWRWARAHMPITGTR